MSDLYENQKPTYEKSSKTNLEDRVKYNSKVSIDYLLPEWVSVLKKYFKKELN